uniref:Uncharacterized protein n=1 Tax=Arundo donax TaxID=35708 RepID=A0A0A9G7Z1_ARUDO
MDAVVSVSVSVSLHHLGALPPPHHHRVLPLQSRRSSSSAAPSKAARLTLAARPGSPARSAPAVPAAAAVHSSSRAATGYAAALADACVRAGTLRRALRHARALLFRHQQSSSSSSEEEEEEEAPAAGRVDARVAALVRMLVSKGKAGMVGEVMADFAAICDHLLPLPARANAY